MLLIRCPWCGPRDEVEFRYGGQAGIAYPPDPATRSTTPPGPTTCSCATTRRARSRSAGATPPGCRRWFNAVRDTLPTRSSPSGRPERRRPTSTRVSGGVRRLATGGRLIDRSKPVALRVRRRPLLRVRRRHAGVRAARQRGRHRRAQHLRRPARGVFVGAGAEDPNALVAVRVGAAPEEPMLRATQVELVDGLVATSLRGGGRWSSAPTRRRFDHRYAHCDVLVVGGGPAGIAAAVTAAARRRARAPGRRRPSWADRSARCRGAARRAARVGVDRGAHRGDDTPPGDAILTRATALGLYDHGWVTVGATADPTVEGRLWHVRAKRIVLATGAIERPIVFRGDDRPGMMLASAAADVRRAVRGRARRACGRLHDERQRLSRCAVAGATGVEVAAVVDARSRPPRPWRGRAMPRPGPHGGWSRPRRRGAARVVVVRTADGMVARIPCDLLAVSGGWNPTSICGAMSAGRPAGMSDRRPSSRTSPPDPSTSPARSPARSRRVTPIRQGIAAGVRAAALARVPRALGVRRAGGHRPLLDRRRRRRAGRRRVRAAASSRPPMRAGRALRRPPARRDRRPPPARASARV